MNEAKKNEQMKSNGENSKASKDSYDVLKNFEEKCESLDFKSKECIIIELSREQAKLFQTLYYLEKLNLFEALMFTLLDPEVDSKRCLIFIDYRNPYSKNIQTITNKNSTTNNDFHICDCLVFGQKKFFVIEFSKEQVKHYWKLHSQENETVWHAFIKTMLNSNIRGKGFSIFTNHGCTKETNSILSKRFLSKNNC